MNNDPVLAELRKISAWADWQRQTTRRSLVFWAALVSVAIGAAVLLERDLKTNLGSHLSPQPPDWYEVDRQVHRGEFEKATVLGEELIAKTPQYPEAHLRLAGAYLAAGNLEKAREHYAEAFHLFPSEENEKLLSVIEKRVRADKP
jgi:tetratricopeptide (TPR) repeat protein